MTDPVDQDEKWMLRAFENARKGEGQTRPNPPVGAVIVKGQRLVAEGYHRRAGGRHAEIEALRKAPPGASTGSTLYVTLEPCSTLGRTGACTDAIVSAGIARVVYSVRDPNPEHRGRAASILERAGIAVTENLLTAQGLQLIAPFTHFVAHRRPLVRLKLATTLDGRLADRRGHSKWITSPVSRREVQAMRKVADAIMVGVDTAISDNPSLLYRRAPRQERFRIVLDSHARLPLSARVLNDGMSHLLIVATTRQAPQARVQALRAKGADVWILPQKQKRVSLTHLLNRLGKAGMLSVLCEGGAKLADALLREDLVDELTWFIAPRVLGRDAVPAIDGTGWLLADAPVWSFECVEQVGPDVMIRAVRAKR